MRIALQVPYDFLSLLLLQKMRRWLLPAPSSFKQVKLAHIYEPRFALRTRRFSFRFSQID